MGRTGDARVVVADRLLALPGQLLVVEIQAVGTKRRRSSSMLA